MVILQLQIDDQIRQIPHRVAEIAFLEIDGHEVFGGTRGRLQKDVVAMEIIVAEHPRMLLYHLLRAGHDLLNQPQLCRRHDGVRMFHGLQHRRHAVHGIISPHPFGRRCRMDSQQQSHDLRETLRLHHVCRGEGVAPEMFHRERPRFGIYAEDLGTETASRGPGGAHGFGFAGGGGVWGSCWLAGDFDDVFVTVGGDLDDVVGGEAVVEVCDRGFDGGVFEDEDCTHFRGDCEIYGAWGLG